MVDTLDLRLQRKYISAAEMKSFLDDIPAETNEGRRILDIARSYLDYCKSIDRGQDIVVLHRCPICSRFPSFNYSKGIDSTTLNPMLEISVRCKCPVGVRAMHIFNSWEMQSLDSDRSEAEHDATIAWNGLVEERKKEVDDDA